MKQVEGWKKAVLIVGSVSLIVAMIAVWVLLDLDAAAETASVATAATGVIVLALTLLGSGSASGEPVREALRTGTATTSGDGEATTGIDVIKGMPGSAKVTDSGHATAFGGRAVTGISEREER